MDEDELLNCMQADKQWLCPVGTCGKVLSRKQTLQSHLQTAHNVQAGNAPKRYKIYESDHCVSVPRTTTFRRTKRYENAINMAVPFGNTDDNSVDDMTTQSDVENEVTDEHSNTDLEPSDNADVSFIIDDYTVHDMEIDVNYPHAEAVHAVQKASLDNYAAENSVPLYIIPPSSNIYESRVTRFDHVMSLCALAARHNISDTLLKDIVQLVQMHLPKQNVGVTDINELKGACGFDKNYLNYHTYCEHCKKLFDDDLELCQTPNCDGKKSDVDSKKYFITSDLGQQVKEVLQRKDVWNSISELENTLSKTIITDIRSANAYKELQRDGGFLETNSNITLSMFIDGVPLFKSSGVSMWPVYFIINEIPPNERFLKKNMLLWGIWQGSGKPKMTMFLKPLVTDLLKLHNDGVNINIDNTVHFVKAKVVVVTMDLQARAYVTNMTHHNGECPCIYCLEPGETVKSGKGTCRSFPSRPHEPRSDEMIRQAAMQASADGKRHYGIVGESILSCLPYFSLTQNIVIDYMHGTLLGITKKLLDLWLDTKYKSAPHYIGNYINILDNYMKKICPPYIIHRTPRRLSNTYGHWKASELRNWLLFFSIPCLKGILPDVYLFHYAFLVEATYILLSEGLSCEDLAQADVLLKMFVENMDVLYGKEMLSLNVHNLNHTVNIVKQWGPLWGFSCFPFESFNGEIKQSVHGTGNVCRQIFWAFQAQKRIAQILGDMPKCLAKDYIHSLELSRKRISGIEVYQCKVVKMSEHPTELGDEIMNKLNDHCGENRFFEASKIQKNGYTMYTNKSKKVKKQNSYTIRVNSSSVYAVKVQQYLVEDSGKRKVYAIGKALTKAGHVLNGRVPHLIQLEESTELTVVPAENLLEPLVVMKNGADLIVASFPNPFERD